MRDIRVGLPVGLAMLIVLLALAAIHPTTTHSTSRTSIGPALDAALEAPAHPLRSADRRIAVWVYFVERELTLVQRETELARTEAKLSPDAARRRSKVALPGERLVGIGDLPVDPGHLAAAAATGAELRQQSRWLHAASYNATDAQVRALGALSQVRRVDVVWRTMPIEPAAARAGSRPSAKTLTEPLNSWTLDYGASLASLELINVPPLHEMGYTGAGVTLGMLDTGFRMTHEALDHVPVLAQYDFADDDSVVDTEPGDPAGTHAHGTQVLSTAVGFAPGNLVGPAFNASVVLARACDISFSNPIEEDWWVAALEWAEAQGVDLISSSLGFLDFYSVSDFDGNTAASTIAADMAAARGLLVFNAAGNQGGTTFDVIIAPADGDSVVAVGSTDVNGAIAAHSSSGPTYDGRTKPDMVAQGMQVTVVDANDDLAYTTAGGTSLAAPFVAGVAALILERAPFLDPVQVREALRETASRHETPDNHYGWGVVDALEAVFYWGPNFSHAPLSDTEDPVGPYAIDATLSDQFPLVAQSPTLYYRVDGGAWQPVPMSATGDDYAANIPGQPIGSSIDYYFEAADTQGLTARLPLTAPTDVFSFTVWEDTLPPALVHSPLSAQPLSAWPPAITTSVTDNLGVAGVSISFSINGGSADGPYPLIRGLDDIFARNFPLDGAGLSVGDVISYTITATDASLAGNQTQSGPHEFELIGSIGRVLVIDDVSSEGATVGAWLNTAGYTSTVKTMGTVVASDFDDKDVVVSLSGNNATPLGRSFVRSLIQTWVGNGGRLLIEGGETGYAALIDPGYGSFGSEVMHAAAWLGDSSGALNVATGMAAHALLTQPMLVSPPVDISYSLESDQDAIQPLGGADLVLESADLSGTAGVIIYDDNPIDPALQVVYFPFALSAVTEQNQAQALVVNAVAQLLNTALPTDTEGGVAAPSMVRLLGITPNPFNSQTVLSIEMLGSGSTQMDIYDVRGRRIRRLVVGQHVLPAGPHEYLWDGRNEDGRTVSSGVYFVRLSAAGTVKYGKMVLIR